MIGGRRLAPLLDRGGRLWNFDGIAGLVMVGLGASMLAANLVG